MRISYYLLNCHQHELIFIKQDGCVHSYSMNNVNRPQKDKSFRVTSGLINSVSCIAPYQSKNDVKKKKIITGTSIGSVDAYRSKCFERLWSIVGCHDGLVNAVAVYENTLVTCGADEYICIVNVIYGSIIFKIKSVIGFRSAIAVDIPKKKAIIASSSLFLYDIKSKQLLHELVEHTTPVRAVVMTNTKLIVAFTIAQENQIASWLLFKERGKFTKKVLPVALLKNYRPLTDLESYKIDDETVLTLTLNDGGEIIIWRICTIEYFSASLLSRMYLLTNSSSILKHNIIMAKLLSMCRVLLAICTSNNSRYCSIDIPIGMRSNSCLKLQFSKRKKFSSAAFHLIKSATDDYGKLLQSRKSIKFLETRIRILNERGKKERKSLIKQLIKESLINGDPFHLKYVEKPNMKTTQSISIEFEIKFKEILYSFQSIKLASVRSTKNVTVCSKIYKQIRPLNYLYALQIVLYIFIKEQTRGGCLVVWFRTLLNSSPGCLSNFLTIFCGVAAKDKNSVIRSLFSLFYRGN